MDEQSGESKEKEVMGEGIGESEMEEMVTGTRMRLTLTKRKGVDSRNLVKHNERSYQLGLLLGLERIMTVTEQELRRMKSELCEDVEQR